MKDVCTPWLYRIGTDSFTENFRPSGRFRVQPGHNSRLSASPPKERSGYLIAKSISAALALKFERPASAFWSDWMTPFFWVWLRWELNSFKFSKFYRIDHSGIVNGSRITWRFDMRGRKRLTVTQLVPLTASGMKISGFMIRYHKMVYSQNGHTLPCQWVPPVYYTDSSKSQAYHWQFTTHIASELEHGWP